MLFRWTTVRTGGTWCLVSGPDYYQQIPQELERNGGRLTKSHLD